MALNEPNDQGLNQNDVIALVSKIDREFLDQVQAAPDREHAQESQETYNDH